MKKSGPIGAQQLLFRQLDAWWPAQVLTYRVQTAHSHVHRNLATRQPRRLLNKELLAVP
jgi:hypothetical protein